MSLHEQPSLVVLDISQYLSTLAAPALPIGGATVFDLLIKTMEDHSFVT